MTIQPTTTPTVTPDAPTQVRFSARAVVRTVLQVGIPALIALGLVVPQIVDAVLEQFGQDAPSWLRAALLGTAAAVTGVAAAIARIMAIPQVEAFLRSSRFRRWLAAEPEPVPAVDVDPDAAADAAEEYVPRHAAPLSGDSKADAAYHGGAGQ